MGNTKLQGLQAVVAVSRRGNFRAAAAELAMSPTAIGNAVAELEKELGVRLFDRTTRRVDLTAAGHDFVHAIAPALSIIDAATASTRGQRGRPAGTLRINCSIGGGHQILVPFVSELLQRHEEIKVDLVTEGRLVDIVHAGFDAGVRRHQAIPPNMTVIPLRKKLRHVVVGSPKYFETYSRPEHPNQLLQHNCIQIRWPSGKPYEWEFEKDGEAISVAVPWSLGLDNHALIARAALADMGLAYVAKTEVDEHIVSGRLTVVLEEWMPDGTDYSFYFPRHQPSGSLVALFAEIIEELQGSAP